MVRNAIQILGFSECGWISVIVLKDVYHGLKLATESQKHHSITPYYGSDAYLYQSHFFGLSVSTAI